MVRRVDASLDEAEHDPPAAAKAIIDVARGPVGAATVQSVTAAAKATVQVSTTALKVGLRFCSTLWKELYTVLPEQGTTA